MEFVQVGNLTEPVYTDQPPPIRPSYGATHPRGIRHLAVCKTLCREKHEMVCSTVPVPLTRCCGVQRHPDAM